MNIQQLLIVLCMGLISATIQAKSLESVLPQDNARTPKQMVAGIENLPLTKREAVYAEIGRIANILPEKARDMLLSGEYEQRKCLQDEMLDTAGYDPNTESLRYAPRFCRDEQLLLINGEVVASAGCGNPSKGQYRKVQRMIPVTDGNKTKSGVLVQESGDKQSIFEEGCYYDVAYYVSSSQSFSSGNVYPLYGTYGWHHDIVHVGYVGDQVNYPIFVGGGERLVCPDHSQFK